MMEEQLMSGPYRATLLWNSLIRVFLSDVPLGRHRRYMKAYDQCFVASDAVEWLHQYLIKNPNFGIDVSRVQTVMLLQKLHQAGIFEDVNGQKSNGREFADSGRLFRLTKVTPSRLLRTPLALKNHLKAANQCRSPLSSTQFLQQPIKLDFEKLTSTPSNPENENTLLECHFTSKPLTVTEEVEQQWKETLLESLQMILGVPVLDDIIDSRIVSGKNIRHNCLCINKSGVVTNIDSKDQFPHYVLSAMKCLAYWPDKIDGNLPNYPSCEENVFGVVRDYFCGQSEPLMTYKLYDVIANVFECQDALEDISSATIQSEDKSSRKVLAEDKSSRKFVAEDKCSKKVVAEDKCSKKVLAEEKSSRKVLAEDNSRSKVLDVFPLNTTSANGNNRTKEIVQPITRYETTFGPDNKTITRIFYGNAAASEFNQIQGESLQEHFPEVSVETSPTVSDPGTFCWKGSARFSIHKLFSRRLSVKKIKTSHGKICTRKRHNSPNLNEKGTFKCTLDICMETPSNFVPCQSPSSGFASVTGSDLLADGQPCHINPVSPINTMLSSYDTLFPKFQYPISPKTIVDASNRRKSMSASMLSHRQTHYATSGSKLRNTSDNVKNMLATRCFSISDLPVASSSTVRNKQQEQWCGETKQSEESAQIDESKDKTIKILQLICLLLPPANRRRLHLLFLIMNKISTNEKLVLDKTQSSRNLLLDTFYRVVLSCPDDHRMDDLLIIELVSFLMDNYLAIFMVPTYLKCAAEARIEKLQRTKIYYSCEDMSVHFCQQMSLDDYENQKMSASQQALSTLLDEIINDPSIAAKTKSSHLKQFQRTYPDTYVQRFPGTCNTDSRQQKTNIKQPCLAKPMLKLRGLRL